MRLKIEKLVYNGYGLGKAEGLVVFVPFTAPEDVVEVEVVERKRDYAVGVVKEIVEPSPYRVSPPCENFGRCGGCQWLHIAYEKQIEAKKEILAWELKKKLKEIPEIRVVSSPETHYRRRALFKVENRFIGFYQFKSKRVIPVGQCLQITENMNTALLSLYSFPSILKNATEIWMGEERKGEQLLVFIRSSRKLKEIHDIFRDIKDRIDARLGLRIAYKGKASTLGIAQIEEEIMGKRLIYGFESFFQANRYLTEPLAKTVVSAVSEIDSPEVLELFCGAGTFTLPLSEVAKHVWAVERNPYAVRLLKEAISLNAVENVSSVREDAESFIKGWERKIDVLILDPPRTGAKEVMKEVNRIKPKKLIYISCNPTTLARDLALLDGCKIERLHLFDMFPHTFHIEAVAEVTL